MVSKGTAENQHMLSLVRCHVVGLADAAGCCTLTASGATRRGTETISSPVPSQGSTRQYAACCTVCAAPNLASVTAPSNAKGTNSGVNLIHVVFLGHVRRRQFVEVGIYIGYCGYVRCLNFFQTGRVCLARVSHGSTQKRRTPLCLYSTKRYS